MTKRDLGDRSLLLFGDEQAPNLLIQPVDDHDEEGLAQEAETIRSLTDVPFALAALRIRDWNTELSPWEAPPVFGSAGFGAGAAQTLRFITEEVLPALGAGTAAQTKNGPKCRVFLGGYSLAGLFALWAGYQTAAFAGVAGVSPSVWFPGWKEYAAAGSFFAPACYLSLGDREAKTRNRTMAAVAENILLQKALLERDPGCAAVTFCWNPGNHFAEPAVRTARGFAWLLEQCGKEEGRPARP